MDTLLGHCLLRSLVASEGGAEATLAKFGRDVPVRKWDAVRASVGAMPKAMRVATFIVSWAIAMRDEGCDSYSITEYQRYWNENERKAYRVQNEFRELWPEFETPNELARQIVKYVDARLSKKDVAKLSLTLQVEA